VARGVGENGAGRLCRRWRDLDLAEVVYVGDLRRELQAVAEVALAGAEARDVDGDADGAVAGAAPRRPGRGAC